MNDATLEADADRDETPLDPTLPIVDPHQHLWDHGKIPGAAEIKPFLLQEFVRTVAMSGHNVVRTVYVECNSMYRLDGPDELRAIGETEFANGQAAMSASGRYGATRVATGIVSAANLRLGNRVTPVLEAQIAAGNGRVKGIRSHTAYAESGLFGRPAHPGMKGVMLDKAFRDGVRATTRLGLTLDVWCLHLQLLELADLASSCPDANIILDHVGTPLKRDAHLGRNAAVFAQWRAGIVELSRRPNVAVKLGGLGMDVSAPIGAASRNAPSTQLAAEWRPYVETCLEAFGPKRCMFESNFPVDNATCSYGALWNAFKMIAGTCSADEKAALFGGTARTFYRLD